MTPAKPTTGMFCLVDPEGNFNQTKIGSKPQEVIEMFLDEERVLRGALCGHVCPSWEVFEAEGWSIQPCEIVPAKT